MSRVPARGTDTIVDLALAVVGLLVLFAVGGTGVVLGEADDSPGLQLLGALVAGGAVVLAVRRFRRGR